MNPTMLTAAACGCSVFEEQDPTAKMIECRVGICMKHWRMVPIELRSDIKDARYAARSGLPGAAERLMQLVEFAFQEINRLPQQQQSEGGAQ
jgi:hypothetical protein